MRLNPDVSGLFLPPDLNLFTLRKNRSFPHQKKKKRFHLKFLSEKNFIFSPKNEKNSKKSLKTDKKTLNKKKT